jgi:hypothetical protein
MRRWRWIVAGLALLAVAAGAGWWFGSPWWTLSQIRQAAEARDLDRLMTFVDQDALREQAKSELRARLRSPDPFRLRAADLLVMGVIAEGLSQGVTTPEGLRKVFAGEERAPFGLRVEDLDVARDGFDQFRLVSKTGPGVELVFRRHGLGWKLSGVLIPEGARALGQ